MPAKLQEQIDDLLSRMEAGELSMEASLDACAQDQPMLLDYLFQEEHDLLTETEKNQLLFLFSVLWQIKNRKQEIQANEIEDLEEAIWTENEIDNFPYSSSFPLIESLDDEIFALVIDCADKEIHEITEVGEEWILVKGFVLACLLNTP